MASPVGTRRSPGAELALLWIQAQGGVLMEFGERRRLLLPEKPAQLAPKNDGVVGWTTMKFITTFHKQTSEKEISIHSV